MHLIIACRLRLLVFVIACVGVWVGEFGWVWVVYCGTCLRFDFCGVCVGMVCLELLVIVGVGVWLAWWEWWVWVVDLGFGACMWFG